MLFLKPLDFFQCRLSGADEEFVSKNGIYASKRAGGKGIGRYCAAPPLYSEISMFFILMSSVGTPVSSLSAAMIRSKTSCPSIIWPKTVQIPLTVGSAPCSFQAEISSSGNSCLSSFVMLRRLYTSTSVNSKVLHIIKRLSLYPMVEE